MSSPTPPDLDTKEGWDSFRELRMAQLQLEIDDLIEMHDRFGESLQKSYLWKARHALKSGLDWFKWERERKSRA